MSRKNLDFSEFNVQTKDSHSQEKSGKYSAFIENEKAQNKETELIEDNTSGEKEKRVNMAFTDNNYKLITSETSRIGVNFMYFLNYIINSISNEEIDKFMDSHPLLRGGRRSAPRRKGNKLKRINFKINTENHEKLNTCALKNNATITTIVNAIIEMYATKNGLNS